MPQKQTYPGRIAAITVGAALAALMLAGCHDDTPPAGSTVVTPPPATTTVVTPGAATTTTPGAAPMASAPDTKINTNAGAGASTGTDTALSDAVNTAIVHNKQMTGSRVEPVATAGIVTLNGQVQNQQQKALAEKTASQTPGVSSVKNKLIIVTTGGAKPKPTVVTKTKTIVIHDKAVPMMPPTDTAAPPVSEDPAAPPAAPDAGSASPGNGNGATNP